MSSLEKFKNSIRKNKYWASNTMNRIEPIVMALDRFFSDNCPSYNNCRIKLTRNCSPLELLALFPENVTFADIYEYMKNDRFNPIDLTEVDGFEDTDEWFVNAFQTTFSDYTISIWKIDMTLGEWLEHMRDDDVCDCFDALNQLLNNLESSMMEDRFFYNRDIVREKEGLRTIPEIKTALKLPDDIQNKISTYHTNLPLTESIDIMSRVNTSRTKMGTNPSGEKPFTNRSKKVGGKNKKSRKSRRRRKQTIRRKK
jgi:hypothetical protein